MSELPSGTLTFLFTDIEGSTRLLYEVGAERYAERLADHSRVLREAFARHGGVEVDTQGDSFFVVFPTAPGAFEAAREAQEASSIPVRMGLHTGTPLLTDEGYVGTDVHRAARIAAAGHGGQVLVSSSTAALLDASSALLRDLGEHRLKDLSAPERLYQAGDGEFPPLNTLYQTNLPVPATPFLGRQHELADVLGLLARDDVRLLTLSGPGGTGKTRLALQAAAEASERFPDGVFWVPLAPLRDPALVLETTAQTLGARDGVAQQVADKRLLLLLDNFEHLIQAAEDVGGLVASCPNLRVLVTSRELLGLPGEQAYPVLPLEPEDGRELFIARARAAKPDFVPDNAVPELCARLDNLPLALELAAARVRVLTPAQLLERLSSRLDVLKAGRGVDPRQQTLRATIEWSYDLLEGDDQRLFAQLAVFRGGCTFDAAEQVCDADLDTVQSLVDKSLVHVRDPDRFWMLETIREFAAEQLEASGDAEALRRRHAEHFLELAESANLAIEDFGRAPQRHELVIPEQDNLRAALDWAGEADIELAIRLMCALESFWITHDAHEGRRRFAGLVARAAGVDQELRARMLRDYGGMLDVVGELDDAERAYGESLALYEHLGDQRGVLHQRIRLGVMAAERGDLKRARSLWEECLARARELEDRGEQAGILGNLGYLEAKEGNAQRALELTGEALDVAREFGLPWFETINLGNLAELSIDLGRIEEGRRYAKEALEIAERIGDRPNMVWILSLNALLARIGDDLARAGRLWGAAEAEAERTQLGRWQQLLDELGSKVVGNEADFESGRAHGRLLSLQEAVREVVGA